MKFLIDQQLPRALARWMSARGHQASHVKDLGLQAATDRELWRHANSESLVIVTKDEDFVGISREGGGPAVVWVRLGNCSNARLMERVDASWQALLTELERGTALIELR